MTVRRPPHARWIVVLAVAAVLAGLFAWLFAPRPLSVDTAEVRRGPIAETVEDEGTAQVRNAYVVAAPVTGRVERVALEVGDRVEAGAVAAWMRPIAPQFLDPRSRVQAQAAVRAADAAVSAAVADRERLAAEDRRAAAEHRRVAALAARGFASRQALETAEAAAAAARKARQAADAAIQARRADAASARALLTEGIAGGGAVAAPVPVSGVVTRVLQKSERTVLAGEPLVEIGDTRGLEAAVEFLSEDAVRIREGQPAEIYDWGGPGVIPARVRRIEPQGFTKVSALGVEEQRVLVWLQFEGRDDAVRRLAPGYRVWGRVVLRRDSAAVTIPPGALVRDRRAWAVYRVEEGRAQLRRVEVGIIGDEAAEIRRGLAPGQQVVLFPSDQVRDGARVRARRD